ncbi:hydantoinase/oxoprolinase family protein [Persicimonas caeni]|uniref:Hydantoinase/oxoprolinase family protein n=1 Tax=Persicimonas caeni TaxID=2292766 RepID=A0A4Y6PPQ0_PERCE|nr:hydantoinase/oxoprolinase family protein [Persicimonas caeni]QDG49745.1 hydantoinase/oxoprolinase family protein [Persicimonas caeni]QED30966.1 hydantoinase/oxoprolinase family protein [Persicimonas caeni]
MIGVDTGGTFTDLILREPSGRVRLHKLLSTPSDPSEAIGDGVAHVVADSESAQTPHIVHGTTVATNALLERKGARVAFVTTDGFEDLLLLRRQNRPDLYRFHIELPPPLVDGQDCYGVSERVGYDGRVLEALDGDELERIISELAEENYEAISVCLLHAYANPKHEEELGRAIRQALPDAHVSLSHDIIREFREFERASTTSVNAFVGPVMAHYLQALRGRVEASRIEILQSSGGRSEIDFAAEYPVHTVLSGPAGGVVGALSAAREIGIERIITFDMGGTSTDVSLCDGEVLLTSEAEIGGLPIHVPVIDIHTVGAGGGSIAYADPGGALRVGPRSAGADPGPACYGRGGHEPAVTDAHVHLGRIRPDRFLGGRMTLERDASEEAIARLAEELGLDADQTAQGILDIADANMVRAIKAISLEKGYDPRDFCLVAFGGAGAMHACRLASTLDIGRVLVPRHPGLLSAFGMLNADSQRLYSKTFLRPLSAFLDDQKARRQMRDELRALEERAHSDLQDPQEQDEHVELEWSLDLRYEGQSFEISVPVDWSADDGRFSDPSEAFEERHERLYGYRAEGRQVELVTLRLKAFVPAETFSFTDGDADSGADSASSVGEHETAQVGFKSGTFEARIIERDTLDDGEVFEGPAVISEFSSTTLVPPDWRVEVIKGHLLLTHHRPEEEVS